MQRDEALTILAAHRQDLESFGVKSIALFGSVARNEARPDSRCGRAVPVRNARRLLRADKAGAPPGDLLGRPVDLATPGGLKRQLRDRILLKAVYAA